MLCNNFMCIFLFFFSRTQLNYSLDLKADYRSRFCIDSILCFFTEWYLQKRTTSEIDCLRRSIEKDRREDKAMVVIHEIRRLLYTRRDIICNNIPYFFQQTREQELTNVASSDPIARQLNIKADLLKIFQHPEPCSRATIDTCVEDWQRKLKDFLENEQK